MITLPRAWDLAQDSILRFKPDQTLAYATEQLLEQMRISGMVHCAIVEDSHGIFLGTLSTHKILRVIGNNLNKMEVFTANGINQDKAIYSICRSVSGELIKDHIFTKAIEVAPQTSVEELLKIFSKTTAHYAIVTETKKALGILELDHIFKVFADDMLSSSHYHV